MKAELLNHLPPLLATFIILSLTWVNNQSPAINLLYLALGLAGGAFFLDIDHFIYWFYTHPNLEESRLAAIAWKRGDFRSIIRLLAITHHRHTNLIFHHFSFQIVLALISLFAFTSTKSIIGRSFLLSLNLHLLVDEIADLRQNPQHLQEWLFSRFPKQLPISYLSSYLLLFCILFIIFLALMAI